jgi:hypothetical protein
MRKNVGWIFWTLALVVLSAGVVTTAELPTKPADASSASQWTPGKPLSAKTKVQSPQMTSVSCTSPGNCAAVGYTTSLGTTAQYDSGTYLAVEQAIVVTESNGNWGKVSQVATALNTGNDAELQSVSCESKGNCVAVGYYTDGTAPFYTGATRTPGTGAPQSLAVTETNGVWNDGVDLTNVSLAVTSTLHAVSCSSVGNCTAVGSGASASTFAYAVTMTNGVWTPGVGIGEFTGAPANSESQLLDVACTGPSDCVAVGGGTASNPGQAFVANMVNGTWSNGLAIGVNLNAPGHASSLASVSCSSFGDCAAVGFADGTVTGNGLIVQKPIALGVTETSGTWNQAFEIAHSLNTYHAAQLDAVSCANGGSCTAVGYFTNSKVHLMAVTDAKGTWGKVVTLTLPPDTGAITVDATNNGESPDHSSVSCVTTGHCVAVFNNIPRRAFAEELSGTKWVKPTLLAMNLESGFSLNPVEAKWDLNFNAGGLSCTASYVCSAVGDVTYTDDQSGNTTATWIPWATSLG